MTTYRLSARLCTLLPPWIIKENWPLANTIKQGSEELKEVGQVDGSDKGFIEFLCTPNSHEVIADTFQDPKRAVLLALVGRQTDLWAVYNEVNRSLWKE
ncbi:MAG TPA: hypothetical protein PLS49_07825 [Candidatus Woesebacteria bacterium]|nr:hypothetical protein [Candidatus Woesebacteria bacterium]